MKRVYTVVLIPNSSTGFTVGIPAFHNWTEGNDLYDAIRMARDAIGILGVTMEDHGETIPEDQEPDDEYKKYKTALVDIDFDVYRRSLEQKSVRKNITIPAWLDAEAKKKSVNFSKVMQDALMEIVDA